MAAGWQRDITGYGEEGLPRPRKYPRKHIVNTQQWPNPVYLLPRAKDASLQALHLLQAQLHG